MTTKNSTTRVPNPIKTASFRLRPDQPASLARLMLFCVCLAFAVPAWAAPTEVWVDDDYSATAANGGHTWAVDAFAVLQEGVDAVAENGTVNVAPGNYKGAKSSKSIHLKSAGPGVNIRGASPAWTQNSGSTSFDGQAFSTATDDPTILVNGGTLTMSNCTINESTGFDQAAIKVVGGTLVLTPGNTININGAGSLVLNQGANAIAATGNTWKQDGTTLTDNFAIEDKIFHALDAGGGGLVTWVANNVYVTTASGAVQRGISAASAGFTINIAAGTFTESGQIVIAKNLTIIGAGAASTVLKTDANTTLGGNVQSEAWVYLAPGTSLNLQALTLDGTGYQINHALQSRGTLTVNDCTIKNIKHTTYHGRGIVLYTGTGALTNVTMSNIERIGIHVRGAVVSPVPTALIQNLNYTGKGPGLWLDYGVEIGGGGVAEIYNSTITACTGLAGDGSTSAGVMATSYFGPGTAAKLVGNTLTGNTSGVAVGYDSADTSFVLLQNNNLTGNANAGVSITGGTVDAGQVGGSNITGLGISTGGNNLTGYGADNLAPWAIENSGPGTVMAFNNNYGTVANVAGFLSGTTAGYSQSGALYITCPAATSVQCVGQIPASANTLAGFLAQGGVASATVASVSPTDGVLTPGPTEGTVSRNYALTDIGGNSANCTQIITVDDVTPPTITSPANIAVNNDPGFCAAVVASLGTPTTGDNCAVASVVNNHPSTTYPVGTNTVTWTVTDINGLTATSTQTVTVTDNEIPAVTCQPATVNLDANGQGSLTVAAVKNASSDNCGIASETLSQSSFIYCDVGLQTVTLTVTDIHGNSSSCPAAVTVVAPPAPSVVYVDDDYGTTCAAVTFPASGGTGTYYIGYNAFKTIQAAVDAVAIGGTVNVAAGSYAELVEIDKAVTVLGPNAAINPNTGTRVSEAILTPSSSNPDPGTSSVVLIYITADNVTVRGLLLDGDNPSLTSTLNWGGANIDAIEGIASYEGVGQIVLENNILKNLSYSGLDFYNYYNSGAATSGNSINYNRFSNIGTTNYGYGMAILIYNNFYTEIIGNHILDTRVGIQTGNYSQANPGSTVPVIRDNAIYTWRRGMFYNLHYGSASTFSITNNTFTALDQPAVSLWDAILVSSQQGSVTSVIGNNSINGSAATQPTAGYQVWNCPAAAGIMLTGGTIAGCDYGVWINNYDGYSSTAEAGTHLTTLDGVAISGATIAGVYLKDNPLNSNGTIVAATLQNGCSITGSAVGILVDGPDTSVAPGNTALSGLTGNYITLANAAASAMNATAVSFDGQLGSAMTLAGLFTTEDKITHQLDNAALGLVRVKAANLYVTTGSGSIQRGIDAASVGDTVNVAAGTFTENVALNKQVSVIGAGSSPSGTIIATASGDPAAGLVQVSASGTSGSPVMLKDVRVTPAGRAGISVGLLNQQTGTSVDYLTLDNVKVIGSNTSPCTEQERGLYVDLTSSLQHLAVQNCAFDNLHYGWYLHKKVDLADLSTVRYVQVTDTSFTHNNTKGLYAEKLSDATFLRCTVQDNGYDASLLSACSYFAPWMSGFDINLKAGSYANLAFQQCDFLSNGLGGAKEGVGLTVKARDDGGTYGANPATATGVSVVNCRIEGNERGVRFGEPGKNNAGPTGVVVENCSIFGNNQTYTGMDGSAYGGLINMSLAAIDASPNWWGNLSGPSGAANPYGTGNAVAGANVTISPWLNLGDQDGGTIGFQPDPAVNYIPTQLAFAVSPGNGALGATLAPSPQVVVRDASGNLTPWANPAITVALQNNPGSGILTGTLAVTASSGASTFNGLAVTVGGGSALTLSATAPNLTSAISAAFDITNPPPVLASLNPAGAVTGSGGGTISVIVSGSDFVPTSKVYVGGSPVATVFNSASQLTATLATSPAATYNVTVVTPAAGGGTSITSLPFVVGAQPATVWVDDNFGPGSAGGHAWGFDAFATITDGIAAVSSGGTVNVAAGAYNEAVNASKPVTLLGANAGTACGGAGLSLINGGAGTAVTIAANSVTVDGFELTGAIGVSNTGNTGAVIQNNKVNAASLGIGVTAVNGTFTVQNNCVNLPGVKELSGIPTIGVRLGGISGAGQIVAGNNVTGPFYGYLLADVDATTPLAIVGGSISGVMQGVAVVNLNAAYTAYTNSTFTVDGVSMSGFTGTSANLSRNFHAGVYVFTGGADNTATVVGTVTNVTISGTGKPQQDSAGLSFADFSTGSGMRQQITVQNCTLAGNKNRGVIVTGKNANVSLARCTLTDNGADPVTVSGNSGIGVSVANGAQVSVAESYITNPVTQVGGTVTALATFNSGSNTDLPALTVSGSSINRNGNGSLATQSTGTLNASGNWWGGTSDTTIASLMTGSVDFTPYLASGTDVGGNPADGFQGDFSSLHVTAQGVETMGTRIQEGVDLVTASGTVQVGEGSFAENVVVPKQVNLLGFRAGVDARTRTGAETVVVPGVNNPGWGGAVILVQAANVTVDGFTVDGDNTAISGGEDVNGADANAGQGITTTPDGGITGYALSGVTVRNNIIRNLTWAAFYGYATSPSGGNSVHHNLIDNLPLHGPTYYGWGAVVENNFYAQISDNKMTRVRTGIQIDNTWLADPVVETPTVANNDISYRWRGVLLNLQYSAASSWTISGNAITAAGDAIPLNAGLRIWSIQSAVGATLVNNNVSGAYMGVEIWNVPTTSTITVQGGTLTGNAYGVRMPDASTYGASTACKAVLDGATITGSTIAGIAVDSTANNIATELTVTHCSVSGSPAGVLVAGAQASAKVIDNPTSFTGNAIGIDVDAGKALVLNNNLTNNTVAAIRAQNGAIVDAGACGLPDITGGLGVSTGGNNLTGYLASSAKAVINSASTVRAYGNSFGATGGAPSIAGALTGVVPASQSGGLLVSPTLLGSTVECIGNIPAAETTLAGFNGLGGVVSATDGVTVGSSDSVVAGPYEGPVVRTYLLTDACGQTNSATQTFMVDDTTVPSITTCATNQTIVADNSAQAPIPNVTSQIVATDNCSPSLSLSQVPVAGTLVGLGNTVVTVWATDNGGNSNSCSATITVIDQTAPVLTLPANVTVTTLQDKDPFATGYATAMDSNGPVVITYNDSRAGLTNCNATGNILRTWTATDASANVSSGVQTVTVIDPNAPVFTYVPANITATNDPNLCSAVVNFAPTAVDLGFIQGFENPNWVSGGSATVPSTDWNDYNSSIYRVVSGTGGITSKSGLAHAVIDCSSINVTNRGTGNHNETGAFSRMGGYYGTFGNGFRSAVSVYINLADPTVATNGYGFDLSVAVTTNMPNSYNPTHWRDFIFQVASDANTNILVAANNGSSQTKPDLSSVAGHATITNSGWFTFEWVFRNDGGVLAVDLNLRDVSQALVWTKTLSDPSDLIPSIVGGNRYMWFTYATPEKLAMDDAMLERNTTVTSDLASGSAFPVGTSTVTNLVVDACGNSATTNFTVTVLDLQAPAIVPIANILLTNTVGNCTVAVNYAPLSASDNCGLASTNFVPADGSSFPVGVTPVEVVVADIHGNSTTNSFTVTVVDATSTAIATSLTPSIYGNAVTFTATVSACPTIPITGSLITFSEGMTPLGTATLNGLNQATLTLTNLTAGTHFITASYAGDVNHVGSTSLVLTQVINQAELTVTGITAQNKVYDGDAVAALNLGGATLVGAVPGDDVTLVTGGAAGAFNNKNIGIGKPVTITGLTITGTASGNYFLTQPSTVADITPASLIPAITAADKTYDGTTVAEITSRSVTGIIGLETVSLTGGTATFASANAGTWTVTASGFTLAGADAGNYAIVPAIATTNATINPAALSITANSTSKVYGVNLAFVGTEFAVIGLTNSETVTAVTLVSAGATNTAGAASYPIIPSGAVGSLNTNNYTIAYVNGTLTVTPADLLVQADNAGRLYGATNPVFTATYTGFVNSETKATSDVVGEPALTTIADTNSPVGTYDIVATLGTLASANYSLILSNGTLTVGQATILVQADNTNRLYGAANPVFTASYSGFLNGDTTSVLSGAPALSTDANTNSPVGAYVITNLIGTLSATNYVFALTNGVLTVDATALLVQAIDDSKIYDAIPYSGGNGVTYTGFVNGETNNVLGGTLSYTGASQGATNVGTYAITPQGLTSANYSLTFSNGTLTIHPMAATVVAEAKVKTYLATNPPLTAVVTGQVSGGDVIGYSLATTATTGSPVGSYAITVTLGSNPNYSVTATNSTLTVNPATPVLTITSATPINYGQPLSASSISATAANPNDSSSVAGLFTFTAPATVPPATASQAVTFTPTDGVNYTTASGTVIVPVVDPAIVSQPVNVTQVLGGNAAFSVTAVGTPALAYQWQQNNVNLPGQTASNLVLNAIANSAAGNYRVIVTNVTGAVTSSVAVLTITEPPVFTQQPTNLVVNQGGFAQFQVNVNGTSPFAYQWLKNGSPLANGGNILGATTRTLIINPAAAIDDASYSVRVTNVHGTNTSVSATLTVIIPPAITSQPVGLTNLAGTTASFSVTNTGSASAYRWRKNGTNLTDVGNVYGSATPVLTLSNVFGADRADYSVVISNAAAVVVSSNATFWVIDPILTSQPVSLTVNATSNATFTVGYTGTAPSFQWLTNGVPLGGATSQTLALSNVAQSMAAIYSVVVSNQFGVVTSSNATLTVIDGPVIVTQPASLTVNATSNATFTVGYTGTAPSFQWYKGAVPLGGENAASLTLLNVSQLNAAGYSVVLSNAAGVVTSTVATLTVIDGPVITGQPQSTTNNAGTTATFTVVHDGSASVYRWLKNGTNLSNGLNIYGATTATLTLSNVFGVDQGVYSVVVSNSAAVATSAGATLTVIDPFIAAQPVGVTNITGSTVNFSVTTVGTGPMSYQWYQDGVPLFFKTNSTLTLVNIAGGDAGNYTVIITNVYGSATSSPAILVTVPPLIVSQPASLTRNQGQSASFSVAVNGATPFSYQWFKNGTNLVNAMAGETNIVLSFGSVLASDAGTYRVHVTNPLGDQWSDAATLTVIVPPAITSQPVSTTNGVGSTAQFAVGYTGTSPSFQWFTNGVLLAGATGNPLVLSNISQANALDYTVVLSNAAGVVTSAPPAHLTVIELPVITTQPTNVIALVGDNVSFNVAATSAAPLAYQWYFNSNSLPAATGATLNLSSVTTNQAGAYSVTVSNLAGVVTSTTATLSVYTTSVPVLTIHYTNHVATVGLIGVPTYTYAIQASDDLMSWTPMLTNQSPFTLVETNSSGTGNRFYRGIHLP